jgi:hypothetical protein
VCFSDGYGGGYGGSRWGDGGFKMEGGDSSELERDESDRRCHWGWWWCVSSNRVGFCFLSKRNGEVERLEFWMFTMVMLWVLCDDRLWRQREGDMRGS